MNTFNLDKGTLRSLDEILSRKVCSTVKMAEDIVEEIYKEELSHYRAKMIEYVLVHYSVENMPTNILYNRTHVFSRSVCGELESDWGVSFRIVFSSALKSGIPLDEMAKAFLFTSKEDSINYCRHVAIICYAISSEKCSRAFNAGSLLKMRRAKTWFVMKWRYSKLLHTYCDEFVKPSKSKVHD